MKEKLAMPCTEQQWKQEMATKEKELEELKGKLNK